MNVHAHYAPGEMAGRLLELACCECDQEGDCTISHLCTLIHQPPDSPQVLAALQKLSHNGYLQINHKSVHVVRLDTLAVSASV